MLLTTKFRWKLDLKKLIAAKFITNIKETHHESIDEQKKTEPDEFAKEFQKNQIKLTYLQKIILSAGSSLAAIIDPHRHDMIACFGETTGTAALQKLLNKMERDDEGLKILKEKPRINTRTVNIEELRKLPENTFGRAYVRFLDDNNVTPDTRLEVRYMEDTNLAYIMTRYRESHDLVHTILNIPTHMLGEVAVKWVEALNTGLPMCYGGAIFGAIRLRPKQRREYINRYLPWAIANGMNMRPLLLVYWEKRWHQDVKDLRQELGIQLLQK